MDYNTLNSKMENAMSHYEKELASIRTSRASIIEEEVVETEATEEGAEAPKDGAPAAKEGSEAPKEGGGEKES